MTGLSSRKRAKENLQGHLRPILPNEQNNGQRAGTSEKDTSWVPGAFLVSRMNCQLIPSRVIPLSPVNLASPSVQVCGLSREQLNHWSRFQNPGEKLLWAAKCSAGQYFHYPGNALNLSTMGLCQSILSKQIITLQTHFSDPRKVDF